MRWIYSDTQRPNNLCSRIRKAERAGHTAHAPPLSTISSGLPLPLVARAGSAAASAGRRGRRDARRWRKQHRKPLPCEVADPERQRLVQVCSVFEVGPGQGRGFQAPGPLLTIAPLAVCLFLPAGAMAAERIRPLRDSGGPRAPSRCEPRARSRASGRSLRSVPRGTGLRELGTWERRTS